MRDGQDRGQRQQREAAAAEVRRAGLADRAGAVATAADLLCGVEQVLFQGGTAALSDLMDDLGVLAARVDAARVAVAHDAQERGVVAESTSANTAQWVRAHTVQVEPGEARRVARLAEAVDKPDNAPLTEALFGGAVSLGCADKALKEAERVAPVVPDADKAEALGWFLDAAATGGRKDMDHLATWVIGRFGGDQLAHDHDKARRMSGITIAALPGGLTRYVMDLGPEHAAVVDAALQPLSAPQNTTDPDTGQLVLDPRQAPQRRAEALVEVFRRAQGGDETTSVTGTTKLVVTMDLADLVGAMPEDPTGSTFRRGDTPGSGTGTRCGGTGGTGGTGRTREGDLLDAGTIRRLVCDAELIPIVLGAESEPLDVGRQERLFTKGLRTAVVHRDRCCSFPGCDRPPTWCRVHHVKHWANGGTTSLDNAALLCERHHVIVHRDNITATITTTGVRWHI
jgi:hypothetical protein